MARLFLPLLAAAFLVGAARPDTPKKPNVVLILADDFGYGDLKCYGHPYARTPNLDRLAEQGTRFTQAYMTGVTCCPSRTGLMTSKFPARFREYPAAHGFGKQITLTQLLKQAGYRTGHFGKWHIGTDSKPGTYGIDVINSAEEGRPRKRKLDERGRDAPIFDAAMQFIEKNKDGPFYVNVWGHITHFPINPPKALVDKFAALTVKDADFSPRYQEKLAWVRKNGGDVNERMRRYLADVYALDECVGRLLKKLDDLGLADSTIVVFSSDQGAAPIQPPRKVDKWSEAERKQQIGQQMDMMGCAGPLRGGKHGMYEGGVRVPFIVRWPGRVPANRTDSTSVICGIDWLPTLCSLAGARCDVKDCDGEDVSTVWLGKDRQRTKPLFWKTSNAQSPIAIRDGNWKLHTPSARKGDLELYDLSTDAQESKNVAAKHPGVVKALKAKIDKWNATLPRDYLKAKDGD